MLFLNIRLKEIKIQETGFLFFRNTLSDVANNKIKFQVINSDINEIVKNIHSSKKFGEVSMDDYKKPEIR